jgi:hypothetical protein
LHRSWWLVLELPRAGLVEVKTGELMDRLAVNLLV